MSKTLNMLIKYSKTSLIDVPTVPFHIEAFCKENDTTFQALKEALRKSNDILKGICPDYYELIERNEELLK